MKHAFLLGVLLVACGGSTSNPGNDGKRVNGTGATAGGGAGGTRAGGSGAFGGRAAGGDAGTGAVAGGGAGGAGNLPGAGATGGYGTGGAGLVCPQISNDFTSTLEDAKSCDPDSPTACMLSIDSSPAGCGYYTFVDASNKDALDELDVLRGEFESHFCQNMVSCAVGGWGPYVAKCEPTGQGGYKGTCVLDN